MKDADPQQRNEIQSAMRNIFVNASEGTCGYHLVNMGWKHTIPNCVNLLHPSQLKAWSCIVRLIQSWVYSWMTPGNVEDEDEYEISKHLLEWFICSQAVLDIVGEHRFIISTIIHFFEETRLYMGNSLSPLPLQSYNAL
jgi:hypothetical protein